MANVKEDHTQLESAADEAAPSGGETALHQADGGRVLVDVRLAGDYDPNLAETTKVFSIIQNKLLFTATGHAAAELIHRRVDHQKPNIGSASLFRW
ncbi:MAG: virulence RhuM family protein [Deltaproteobacteria bacterium]|jgi:hypothetical protein|nr:virulence RhuM family protein [Deltaproteobacteria bacterium]